MHLNSKKPTNPICLCLSETRLHYVGRAGWKGVMLIAQAAFKHTVFLPRTPWCPRLAYRLYLIHSGEVKAAKARATE